MTGGGAADGRTLVVVRHAKAQQWGTTDHDRALTERGRRDAADTGAWLADRGVAPDAALVSDAVRTRETWAAVAEAAGWGLEAVFEPGVYTAGTDTALDLIRALDASAGSVLVIGHNPTMGSLAQLLDDGEGDAEASTQLLVRGFPTSAAAVFTVAAEWAGLVEAAATLRAYHPGHPG